MKTIAALTVLATAASANAGLTTYDNQAGFLEDAGTVGIMDFVGFGPHNTPVDSGIYSDMGVVLHAGTIAASAIYSDGFAIRGNPLIEIWFDTTLDTIGFDFPGQLDVQLFMGDDAVGDEMTFGGSGAGLFGGAIGLEFDHIILQDRAEGSVFIDNIYFGSSVPAPGAGAILGLAGLASTRRRRI